MKKFLNYIQVAYGYSDYEVELIEYFILTMASELSKLILIYGFFIYRGTVGKCSVALISLLVLRLCSGGFHCEHYITCFLTSFLFIYSTVILSENVPINRPVIVLVFLLCVIIGYKLVPVVSYHRPKPAGKMIHRFRRIYFTFLIVSFVVVPVFYTHPYVQIIFWTWVLHTLQLFITIFDKGGRYHVTGTD